MLLQVDGRKITLFFLLVFAAGAGGVFLAVMGGDSVHIWRALLVNFMFFLPMTAALTVWPAITALSNGGWSRGIDRTALAGIGFAPLSLLLLLLLWVGSPQWMTGMFTDPGFHSVWLDTRFVFGRDLVVLALFWGVAWMYVSGRIRGARGGMIAGLAVLIYTLTVTLFGFDMFMPLVNDWRSSLLGGYLFISGLYAGVALWTIISLVSRRDEGELFHDLGNLVLAFCLLTTYMMFANLIPMWYENLPGEAGFLIPKFREYPWGMVSKLLLVTIYLGPIAMLLWRKGKRKRSYLGIVSCIILAGLLIERWWLIYPAFGDGSLPGLAEAGVTLCVAGLTGISCMFAGRYVTA